MNKKSCVNCGEKVLIRKGKVGTYLIKKEEAESEKLKIVENQLCNPVKDGNPLVLVSGFFCLECHKEVCGEPEGKTVE